MAKDLPIVEVSNHRQYRDKEWVKVDPFTASFRAWTITGCEGDIDPVAIIELDDGSIITTIVTNIRFL